MTTTTVYGFQYDLPGDAWLRKDSPASHNDLAKLEAFMRRFDDKKLAKRLILEPLGFSESQFDSETGVQLMLAFLKENGAHIVKFCAAYDEAVGQGSLL